MRQLQVVGISDDGEALLLGQGAGKPSHRLRLDDKLRAAVRGQLAAVGVDRKAESALTPKEMQARLREGASPEEVAKEAGIALARVLPYAAPVIAERERIVEQARAAVLHRSRGPNGQRPLGELVDAHLSDAAGFKPDTVEWSARRRRDGAWVVLLTYAARGGRRTASWLWRPLERDLTALDASATRLAAEEAPAPRRRAPSPAKKAAKRTTRKSARTARRPAARKSAASTAKKTVKPAAKRSANAAKAVKPAARRAATAARPAKPSPPVKATRSAKSQPAAASKPAKAADVARATKPAKVVPRPSKPTRSRPVKALPTSPVRPVVVPDPILEPTVVETEAPVVVIPRPEPQPEPEPESPQPESPQPIVARRPGQRVPLPSWSDVLLGVSPPETTRDVAARRRRKSG